MTEIEAKINLSNYDLKCQLTDDNYVVWLIKIVNLITVLDIASITTDLNNNKIITFKPECDAKAMHLITTNLSESKTLAVKFCTTAQEMWQVLNEDATGKDQARGISKLLDLVKVVKVVQSGKSMKIEISKMKTLVSEVTSAFGSKDIAFDLLAMLMFAFNLPASYAVQRSQVLRECRTMAEMEVIILQEEKFQCGATSTPDFAGFTGSSTGGKKKRKITWPEGTVLCEEHGYKKAACNRCNPNLRDSQKCANCNELGHRTYYSQKCKLYREHPDPRFQAKPPIHFVDGMSIKLYNIKVYKLKLRLKPHLNLSTMARV